MGCNQCEQADISKNSLKGEFECVQYSVKKAIFNLGLLQQEGGIA